MAQVIVIQAFDPGHRPHPRKWPFLSILDDSTFLARVVAIDGLIGLEWEGMGQGGAAG
jgi:hypothetical protein